MLHPNGIRMNGSILEEGCEANGYIALPILNSHVASLETLKRPQNAPRHNDPFDRIMVAQAKSENLMFLTHDSLIPYYNESFLSLFNMGTMIEISEKSLEIQMLAQQREVEYLKICQDEKAYNRLMSIYQKNR